MKSLVGNRHVLAMHIAQATPKLEAQLRERETRVSVGAAVWAVLLILLLLWLR